MLLPRFEAIHKNDGFDPYCTPCWLMVPVRGAKRIRLINGTGMTVTSTSPHIAQIQEVGGGAASKGGLTSRSWMGLLRGLAEGVGLVRLRSQDTIAPRRGADVREFVVRGLMAGRSYIEVRFNGGLTARMEVGVKPRKTVSVSFNFVTDTGGHSTRRNAQEVPGYMELMNEIMTPQTNIVFKLNNAREVRVNRNLGDVVRFSRHLAGVGAGEHEWDLVVMQGDTTADFNVFFVWEYEQDITPRRDHTDAGTLGGNCIFEDNAGKEVGETLAHEAGHYLGGDDVYDHNKIDRLMYGITDDRGRRIPRSDAVIFNPH